MYASVRCGLHESDAKIPIDTENNFLEDKCDLKRREVYRSKQTACMNLEIK